MQMSKAERENNVKLGNLIFVESWKLLCLKNTTLQKQKVLQCKGMNKTLIRNATWFLAVDAINLLHTRLASGLEKLMVRMLCVYIADKRKYGLSRLLLLFCLVFLLKYAFSFEIWDTARYLRLLVCDFFFLNSKHVENQALNSIYRWLFWRSWYLILIIRIQRVNEIVLLVNSKCTKTYSVSIPETFNDRTNSMEFTSDSYDIYFALITNVELFPFCCSGTGSLSENKEKNNG